MKKHMKLWKIPNRILLIFTGVLFLLTAMIAYTKPESASANFPDLSNIVAKYPILNGSSLQTCDLCHTANIPNLNPYGAAYKANGRNPAAFGLIENLDSDGDGFTNIQEINALTFPGNPASKPAIPTPTKTTIPTAIAAATNTPIPPAPGIPSATPIISPNSAFVTTGLTLPSVIVGGSSIATVSLNNVPTGGFASTEFTCSYNPTIVEVSTINVTNLFGEDPVSVVNGPQNGRFIVAIAGSDGNIASRGGTAFTFSLKALQVGQSAIDCQARVSTGNLVLVNIPSTPANLVTTSTQGTFSQGTFAGQVLARKPVSITLYNADRSIAGSTMANVDGTFSLSVSAGTYTAVASAPGYLKAQGSFTITNGNTTTSPTVRLHGGDIDGNDVIDQLDALTIGINYNTAAPAAADLNNDGIINVLDLEILALNYHQSGALAWQ